MALTTVDFNSYFHYDLATKQIKVTDTTDYVSQGVLDTDITIVIKAETASGGIFYNNVNHAAPDIDPNVSSDSTITIPLPLTVGSLPLQDDYTITLEYQDTSGVTYEVTQAKTFTLAYTSPIVDIEMDVDCITPRLTATDESSYTVSGINPSIVRDFKIHYPPSVPTADVTGTGSTVYTATFYTVVDSTVEHSSSLTSELEYDFTGGFYVVDEVTGSEVIQVACSGDLCDIYCCIRSQWNRYVAVKGKNNVLESQELAIFYKICSLAEMVGMALKCGKDTHISDYVSEILKLANCDAGCSCNDGTPQIVTGLGGTSSSVTVAAGTGIAVNLAGGEYTVSLSTVNIAKLAATYNTVVAAGTNISSVSSATVVAGNVTTTTYTVNATDTVVESMFVEVSVTMSAGNLPSYTITSQKKYGAVFKAITDAVGANPFIEIQNIGSVSNWQRNTTSFKVKNFFIGSAVDYYPEVQIIEERKKGKTSLVQTDAEALISQKNLSIDIYNKDSNLFDIRFINSSFGASNGTELDTLVNFKLIFKIQA